MFDNTPLLYVDTDEGVAEVAARFATKARIGVDTESDSMHHYQEKVSLLQFTDDEGDVIIDPLAVNDLSPIGDVLADPSIVKIMHGSDFDVLCLKRDFDWRINNLFDTLFAAQFVGLDKIGLADLIGRFFGIPIDKAFQRHDWSARPLEPEHIAYARGDTHFLLALHTILKRRLRRVGRMAHQREECRRLSRKRVVIKVFDPDAYLNLRGANKLDDTELRVLRRLYLWRDDEARKRDRPTYKVVHDDLLVKLASHKPATMAALDRALVGKQGLKRRYGKKIVKAVDMGLEDDFPIPEPPAKRKRRGHPDDEDSPDSRLTGQAADELFDKLKTWRNKLIKTSPLYSPTTTFSNNELKAISRARPFDLEEMARLPGVRKWQVADYGEGILELLDKHAPKDALPKNPGGGGKRRRRRRR